MEMYGIITRRVELDMENTHITSLLLSWDDEAPDLIPQVNT
jgi:hypothetical protein